MDYKRVCERIKEVINNYDDGIHLMNADDCIITIAEIIDEEEERPECFGREFRKACLLCSWGLGCSKKELEENKKEKQNGKRCSAKNDKSQETEV